MASTRNIWWRRLWIASAVFVVGLCALLWLSVHSERVTAFALPKVLASLPIDVQVDTTRGSLADGLTLRGLHIKTPQADVDIDTLTLELALAPLFRRVVHIERLIVAGTNVTLIAQTPPATPAPIAAPQFRSPVAVTIDALTVTDTTIHSTSDIIISTINAALALRASTLTLDSLDVVTPDASLDLRGTMTFDEAVPVDIALAWRADKLDVAGRGTLQGDLRKLRVEHDLSGAYRLRSEGSLALVDRVIPAADMTHRCADQCLQGDISLSGVTLTHEGAVDNLDYQLVADVATGPLSTTTVRAQGRFAGDTLSVETGSVNGAEVVSTIYGSVKLGDIPSFNVDARVERLATQMINPSITGSVGGSATVRGTGVDAFTARLDDWQGIVNGFDLIASADVARNGTQWTLQPVDLRLGDNTVRASGEVAGDALDLTINAALDHLEQIAPQWRGALTADAVVGGTLDAPQAKINLNGQALQIATLALGAVDGTLTVDSKHAVDGTLRAEAINVDERDLGTATLALSGTLEEIATQVDWSLPGNKLTLLITTRPSDGGVTATVSEAALTSEAIGSWSLDEVFAIDVRNGVTQIDAHVWRSADAFVQINEAQVSAQSTTLDAILSNLPLQTFDVVTPPGVRLAGEVDATVSVQQQDGVWSGDVDWSQRGTVVQLRDGDVSRRLALPTAKLRGNVVGSDGKVTLALAGDYDLDVSGDLGLSDLLADGGPTLNGTLRASLPDLSWLGPWVGGVSELAGSASLDLNVTGSGARPTLTGQFELSDGSVNLDSAGIRLENLTLRGAGRDAQALTLTGSANSGGGELSFDGQITQPWSTGRAVKVAIKGDNVQAFNARDYKVWVSPDLQLEADAEGARIAGRIDVPRANVRVVDVPDNVVQPSSDVQVTGREPQDAFELPVKGEVTLALGDQVHIFALGLDTDLRGDLKLAVEQSKPPRFNGRLYLENGKFQAYGQKLAVDRGNLFYAGAIDNPTLDFRATRDIPNSDQAIVAGVRVTGPAQDPRIEVFSEPATSSTDALSYLILGRSSADASGADSEALSQTALAIGMSRSSPLTTQLASNLGLDELSVGGDSLDAAELVAGKQVNDRLYIRYTYGVFSNIGAILLRYRLSRRLALEAGSADSQSLDVLYTIEK